MKKRKKKNSFILSVLKFIGIVLLFIIKIPYYIVKGVYKFIKFLTNYFSKRKENTQNKMVRSSKAVFSDFSVVSTEKGDYKKWINSIYNSDSKIGVILGARGSGKTAFGVRFLENIYSKTKRKCYAIGFHKNEMPNFINVVEKTEEIPNNSFVLIDEGGVLFNSRDSMSSANKILSELILIARHKNLSILFISQNSSNLDVNILRQADFLVLRHSSLLQKDFERKIIQKIYDNISERFEKIEDNKKISYIYSEEFRGFISNLLPSFWDNQISKSFR